MWPLFGKGEGDDSGRAIRCCPRCVGHSKGSRESSGGRSPCEKPKGGCGGGGLRWISLAAPIPHPPTHTHTHLRGALLRPPPGTPSAIGHPPCP